MGDGKFFVGFDQVQTVNFYPLRLVLAGNNVHLLINLPRVGRDQFSEKLFG